MWKKVATQATSNSKEERKPSIETKEPETVPGPVPVVPVAPPTTAVPPSRPSALELIGAHNIQPHDHHLRLSTVTTKWHPHPHGHSHESHTVHYKHPDNHGSGHGHVHSAGHGHGHGTSDHDNAKPHLHPHDHTHDHIQSPGHLHPHHSSHSGHSHHSYYSGHSQSHHTSSYHLHCPSGMPARRNSTIRDLVNHLTGQNKRQSLFPPPPDIEEKEEVKLSTFGDLVLYNEEGRPYIDVNKLIYNPKPRVKKEIKERFSWYIWDHLFLLLNFLGLIISVYHLATGIQASTWDTSIESVQPGPTDKISGNTYGAILRVIFQGGREYSPAQIGASILITSAFSFVNVFLGVVACLYGIKFMLIQHLVVDIIILGVQGITGALVVSSGTCKESDILGFQEGFESLVRNYSAPKAMGSDEDDQYYSVTLLHDIQLSMQCCGASNWTDYMSRRVTNLTGRSRDPGQKTLDFSQEKKVFPYSCCRPWWVRNIYCADSVHIWTYPGSSQRDIKKFRERINPTGCVPKIWLACKRLIFQIGQGLLLSIFVHLLILIVECFSVIMQIRSLDTVCNSFAKMMREVKQEEINLKDRGYKGSGSSEGEEEGQGDKQGKSPDAEGVQNDSRASVLSKISKMSAMSVASKIKGQPKAKRASTIMHGVRAVEELKSKLALPTEDEIQFIKSRTKFAEFELRMRRTALGNMIQSAKEVVKGNPAFEQPTVQARAASPKPSKISKKDLQQHRHRSVYLKESQASEKMKEKARQKDEKRKTKKRKQMLAKKNKKMELVIRAMDLKIRATAAAATTPTVQPPAAAASQPSTDTPTIVTSPPKPAKEPHEHPHHHPNDHPHHHHVHHHGHHHHDHDQEPDRENTSTDSKGPEAPDGQPPRKSLFGAVVAVMTRKSLVQPKEESEPGPRNSRKSDAGQSEKRKSTLKSSEGRKLGEARKSAQGTKPRVSASVGSSESYSYSYSSSSEEDEKPKNKSGPRRRRRGRRIKKTEPTLMQPEWKR